MPKTPLDRKPPKAVAPSKKPAPAPSKRPPHTGRVAYEPTAKADVKALEKASRTSKPAAMAKALVKAVVAKATAKPAPPPPAPVKAKKPQPAFPKKNQPPTAAAFAARLPLPLGKRFDAARAYLLKQDGIREEVHFYGPESGWALRYRLGERPLCSLHVYDEQPVGIVSLDPSEGAVVDWRGLSPVGQMARKQAHGSPTLLWIDLPLAATGAADFKTLLRAKLAVTPGAAGAPPGGRSEAQDVVGADSADD